jgi:hypothetical protein
MLSCVDASTEVVGFSKYLLPTLVHEHFSLAGQSILTRLRKDGLAHWPHAWSDSIGRKGSSSQRGTPHGSFALNATMHRGVRSVFVNALMCRWDHRGRAPVKVPTTYAGAAQFFAWAGQPHHFPFDDVFECVYALIVIMESLCNLLVLDQQCGISTVSPQTKMSDSNE